MAQLDAEQHPRTVLSMYVSQAYVHAASPYQQCGCGVDMQDEPCSTWRCYDLRMHCAVVV